MIGYVTLGTNDMQRAARFYDPLLALLGAGRVMETATFIGWGTGPAAPMLMVILPADGNPATVGNGVMIALAVTDKAQVDAVHAKAVSLGAHNEGSAGQRGEGFYAGYFRDTDGNKLCVFFTG